ncbi:MAG: transglutaminase family protein [Phycisphaeraceae bacterium JB051]
MSKAKLFTVVFLTAICLCLTCNAQDQQLTYDHWFSLRLGGQPAGYSHESCEIDADGNLITKSDTQISMSRGPMPITIRITSEFVQTPEGKPLRGQSKQDMSIMQVVQSYKYNADGSIALTSMQNGQRITNNIPKPAQDWMTPIQAQAYVMDELAKGNKQISFWTIDPTAGPQPVQITMKHLGEQSVEVVGKTIPAIAWDMTTSMMDGVVTKVWTDDKLLPVKTNVTPMPGMELEVLLSDQMLATQKVNPPELLVSTMVTPNRPLPNPRKLKHAEYELRIEAGQAAVKRDTLLQSANQQVQWLDNKRAKVIVNINADPIPNAEKPGESYLKATAVLNHQDPEIQKALERALGRTPEKLPVMQRALRLREFVNREIKAKDLSVGFATASEVIRTKQGDCTEHGTLLAAMLRGAGVPSRVVSGMIYVDEFLGNRNIFGYHMWAQAWVDGKWVDLDATLPHTVFDAAHIAMVASDTDSGNTMNDLVKLTPLIGRLKINVLKAR